MEESIIAILIAYLLTGVFMIAVFLEHFYHMRKKDFKEGRKLYPGEKKNLSELEIHKFPADWDYLRIRASSIWTIMRAVNLKGMPWDESTQQAVIDDAKHIVEYAEKEGLI